MILSFPMVYVMLPWLFVCSRKVLKKDIIFGEKEGKERN